MIQSSWAERIVTLTLTNSFCDNLFNNSLASPIYFIFGFDQIKHKSTNQ